MKPYFQDAMSTIYQGDARVILPRLPADLLCTDPPYGMRDKSRRGSRVTGKALPHSVTPYSGTPLHRDWEPIVGDDEPFDPSHLIRFSKAAIFGENHFSSRLPDSRGWLVWDKREGGTSDDGADCDFIWTNLNKPARIHSRLWRGACRRGEENAITLQHPYQKPVGLMQWIIGQFKPNGKETLVDPYMGSGSTLLAAKRMNIPAIGIEIEEKYCEIAAKRLSQEVFDFERPIA